MRNVLYLLRNPRSLNAIVFNAIFVGLLTLALYWNTADESRYSTPDGPLDPRFIVLQEQKYGNWLGFSFLMSNNLFFTSVSVVVLQMPLQVPVFKRELMSNMYGPTIYFLARWLT